MTVDLAEFDFDLPPDLVAQYPPTKRDGGLLLDARTTPAVIAVSRLPSLLEAGDVVVINDSRVLPARLLGRKMSGGRVEILLERFLNDSEFLAQVGSSGRLREGTPLQTAAGGFVVRERCGLFHRLVAVNARGLPVAAKPRFLRAGLPPLPPYIRRQADSSDRRRYQTVYARTAGSVAAPTAGLHLTTGMLSALRAGGIRIARLTLHVGAGTFSPLRAPTETLHSEAYGISARTAGIVNAAKKRGRRIVAVGTTTLRALESAVSDDGLLRPLRAETDLFIRPGFSFRLVDVLFTNFHLPRSSLFVLVCAFAGTARTHACYRHAISRKMRFYSYGDAMLINRSTV